MTGGDRGSVGCRRDRIGGRSVSRRAAAATPLLPGIMRLGIATEA